MARILVILYSRSGYTKTIAEAIASACHADMEVIRDGARRGLFGYLRSGFEATRKKLPDIEPIENDPSRYDLIVIGTPVWAANIASPVRTFVTRYKDKFRNVAFFCTLGGSGAEKVLDDLTQLCGKSPIATVAITDDEIKHGSYQGKLDDFVRLIQEAVQKTAPV